MKVNYHTHTWRCKHAEEDERAYVERAIEGGLSELGFSDHTPYIFPEGYYSSFRMFPDQVEDYVDTVLSLKKEYEKDIRILLGLEVEYYPAYFDILLSFLSQYPIEYMILGQHFLGSEIKKPYSGSRTSDNNCLKGYVDQCIEGMRTGKFLYLAHPDLIHYVGEPSFYQKEMRRLCKEANALKMPLEFNLLGFEEKRHYPNDLFWQVVSEEKNDVILGSDAHRAVNVYREDVVCQALRYLDTYKITPIEKLVIE